MLYERKRCWSVLLRLCHWSFVGSILVLSITGMYISNPWPYAMIQVEGGLGFPMSFVRYYHFLAGYIFCGALVARFFLLIFGNTQERFWDFLPITGANIKNFVNEVLAYLYLKDNKDHKLGHNSLAGTIFFILFCLALIQVISGFYMLSPESLFWQKWGWQILGSQQKARYFHHMIAWFVLIFAFCHVYIVIWNDLKNRDGLISSIITGYKFRPKKM